MACIFQSVLLASGSAGGFHILGIPFEFMLFGLTLLGVALFHHHTLKVAITGVTVIIFYKIFFTDFSLLTHIIGSDSNHGEWRILINLFGLLTGFALLADYFEQSNLPKRLPSILPNDWKGGFVLLVMIAILSAFLDNIAAAMIGGAIAHVVFKEKVGVGYIAAIVGASNAGGAGSVVGDTTTTMMWIDGVDAFDVTHAYYASIPAILFFAVIASVQQQKYQPIIKEAKSHITIDWRAILIVAGILIGAIATNVYLEFPAVGVWVMLIFGTLIRKANWKILPNAIKGSFFLLALVLSASMMPVNELPDASWTSALLLGFVSSVFDNIPLTKLALEQGGYDWGVLAYCVGFGGSMIWFGSSAGVAISNMYPQAKSVGKWLKYGWPLFVAYILGFCVLMLVHGWHPHANHKQQGNSVNIESKQ